LSDLIRTFVAATIPEPVREELSALLVRFKRSDPDIRWMRPEGMHITLKFLGDVPADRISELGDAITAGISGVRAFDAALGGAGCFPDKIHPSVLYVGVEAGRKELTALAGSVDAACATLGFKRERRPFDPHLTVGRVRPSGFAGPAIDAMKEARFASSPFRFGEVVLMKSVLDRTGAVHTVLRTYSLEG
jgi:RNA 2',3'-cyclic 3'-phosphodiesterase